MQERALLNEVTVFCSVGKGCKVFVLHPPPSLLFTTLSVPYIPVSSPAALSLKSFSCCSWLLFTARMSGWHITTVWDGQPVSSSFSLAQPLALYISAQLLIESLWSGKKRVRRCLRCSITASTSTIWNDSATAWSHTRWRALWESPLQHQDYIPHHLVSTRPFFFFFKLALLFIHRNVCKLCQKGAIKNSQSTWYHI